MRGFAAARHCVFGDAVADDGVKQPGARGGDFTALGAAHPGGARACSKSHSDLQALERRLKRGMFRSIVDLQTAINRFIAETNHEPKPWAADPVRVLSAVKRGKHVLEPIH